MRQSVRGRFTDLTMASDAVQRLIDAHISPRHITVLAPHTGEAVKLTYEDQMIPGAIAGGLLGTLAGILGATLVAGPIGGVAAIAVASGALGTAGGAVTGLGWWRRTAESLGSEFDPGEFVWVAVRDTPMVPIALEVLRNAGATDVRGFRDPVDQSGDESFPASDAPSWTPGNA